MQKLTLVEASEGCPVKLEMEAKNFEDDGRTVTLVNAYGLPVAKIEFLLASRFERRES